MSAPERLGPDEVHVWSARPDAITEPGRLEAYEELESPDERCKRRRLHFERDRHDRLISVALVRTSLSRYAALDPAAWVFERNPQGRPDLVAGQCKPSLRFNLSHTRGLIACAVTLEHDIGVDVESLERPGETLAIADRYFSPAEVQDLLAVPVESRRRRFFDYWTLKESYIKARGLGLRIPLRRFSFHLDDPESIRISFDARLEDDPRDWQFALPETAATHAMAVGVRRGRRQDLSVSVRDCVPLV